MSPGREGRRPTERGDRRYETLVEAATDVLAEEGFAAVTHRAVARRADVPLSATTYYFGSREKLVTQALDRLGQRWLAPGRRLAAEVDRSTLADRIVAIVAGSGSRADLVTFYERYVQAARVPAYADVVQGWTNELRDLVARALVAHGEDPSCATRLVALVDGLLLASLTARRPDPLAGLREEVDAVLRS